MSIHGNISRVIGRALPSHCLPLAGLPLTWRSLHNVQQPLLTTPPSTLVPASPITDPEEPDFRQYGHGQGFDGAGHSVQSQLPLDSAEDDFLRLVCCCTITLVVQETTLQASQKDIVRGGGGPASGSGCAVPTLGTPSLLHERRLLSLPVKAGLLPLRTEINSAASRLRPGCPVWTLSWPPVLTFTLSR